MYAIRSYYGYFGYETVKHVEPRVLRVDKPDPLGTPDMLLLVSDELSYNFV